MGGRESRGSNGIKLEAGERHEIQIAREGDGILFTQDGEEAVALRFGLLEGWKNGLLEEKPTSLENDATVWVT